MPLFNSGIPEGVLLHSKRAPFAFQKDSFCTPKGLLLHCKRTPFEIRFESFCKTKEFLLEKEGIFSVHSTFRVIQFGIY